MTMSHMRENREGFTLIEIMIGITILGILGGLVATNVMGYLKKAKVKATHFNMIAIKKAIQDYNMETNQYPEKLRDLIKKPSTEIKGWDGPYLTPAEIPNDGFGEPFKYSRTPSGKNPYELTSYGPKGRGAPKEEWISVWNL